MRRIALTVLVAWIASVTVSAEPPSASAIDQLIRELGDKRFNVREQASKKLWLAGAGAEPALRKAAKDSDPEIVRRAKSLLEKFELGIYPDTPAAVTTQLERYRDGDDEGRRQAATALAELGADGFAALGRLMARAKSDDDRRMLAKLMTDAASKERPGLLKAGKYDALEKLLEACLDRQADEAIANYTALVLLRGKLPATLARWQAEHTAAPTPRSAEILTSLYRAHRDGAAARKHAAVRSELLDEILWEQGEWAELAKRPTILRPALDRAIRAGYFRLAGNAREAEALIDEMTKIEDPFEERSIALGLLLNERPADALKRLAATPDFAFDLLVAQMRFREALEIARKPVPAPENAKPRWPVAVTDGSVKRFGLKRARLLLQIGDRDQAMQQFAKLSEQCQSPVDGAIVAELVETQIRFGLKEAGRETAARYLGALAKLAVEANGDPTTAVLEAAFPKRGPEARMWWAHLRGKFPKEDELATMRRLRELLEPGLSPLPGLNELIAGLILAENDDDAAGITKARLAAAAACEAAGQFDAARAHLTVAAERAGESRLWIRLGDLLAGRQKFVEAADAYAKAAAKEVADPIPQYLQGWALQRAGRAAEANSLFELARMLPLGDVHRRAEVVQELTRRDLVELAAAERDLILKLGWRQVWAYSGFLSHLGRDAIARKDYARAADCYERVMVAVVETGLPFVENGAFVSVPGLAHAYRARAALADGRFDAVNAEAEACLALTPGNLELVILLVPELTKRGRATDADALYARSASAHTAVCKDYPESAFAHNAAAWLAACCRRDLDAALVHAQRATALSPKHAGYRDTLAEVHFQRGDKAKAIALMRECQQMEPRNAYFVKQLKRFEAGDPSVPPPSETDDN